MQTAYRHWLLHQLPDTSWAEGAWTWWQADEAEEQDIELGDQVSFTRVIYCRSGAIWARELQIICKAAHRRELGQVSRLFHSSLTVLAAWNHGLTFSQHVPPCSNHLQCS